MFIKAENGYVLVSNDLSDAKMYNADDAKNRFEIHLKHNTADGTGTPTTTVRHTTITTPDGKKLLECVDWKGLC